MRDVDTVGARGGGGGILILILAMVLGLVAGLSGQTIDTRPGGRWHADLPSEKELSVIKEIVHSEWIGVSWTPLLRYVNNYDHHARVWSCDRWEWREGEWQLGGRQLCSWDPWGQPFSLTRQAWDGDKWVNLERERWSYDPETADRILTRFGWDGSGWAEDSRSVLRFNDDGQVGSVTEYQWSDEGWKASLFTARLFDERGAYCGYERTDLTDNFLCARGTASESICGQLGEEIHYTRKRGGVWERSHRERWVRDDCKVIADFYVDTWREGGWAPWQWDFYMNGPFSLSTQRLPDEAGFALMPSPNPTHGPIVLGVRVPRTLTATVECHDLLGRRLLTLPARQFETGVTALSLQLGALPRGYVFVRLVGERRVLVTSRVLLR